jgi:hypothetical protein
MFQWRRFAGAPRVNTVDPLRRFRWKGKTTVAVLLALAAAPPALAQDVIGAVGKPGAATTWQGTCKYGVFGPRGVLQVGVPAPDVSGANTRRGTRRERTYVRYRVDATDALSDFATLAASAWSGYIRVRQSETRSWSGLTIFDMDWQGNYGADISIEWWNSKRRIGWRVYRTRAFGFYDQYNVGPYGPISSCYKYIGQPRRR